MQNRCIIPLGELWETQIKRAFFLDNYLFIVWLLAFIAHNLSCNHFFETYYVDFLYRRNY